MGGLPRKPQGGTNEKEQEVPQKPEVLVEAIDFEGLSLQDFAAQTPQEEQQSIPVYTYSAQSVEECTSPCLIPNASAHCDDSR